MSSFNTTGNKVIIIGGLLVDDIAISEVYLRAGSSNPVQWQHKLGGVATNVARVVTRHTNTLLIASSGDDTHGKILANLLKKESLSSSLIVCSNQNSDRYVAVLDHNGDLFIGLADVQLAEKIRWHDIESRLPVSAPAAIVIDANLSQQCLLETVTAIAAHYSAPVPIMALAVSPAKSVRWLPVANAVHTLLCNRQEAASITGLDAISDINNLADALLEKQFQQFVITDGNQPVLVHSKQTRQSIPVPPAEIQQNVNGAGDALAGATIAQLVLGQDLAQAVRVAGMDAARSVLTGNTSSPAL